MVHSHPSRVVGLLSALALTLCSNSASAAEPAKPVPAERTPLELALTHFAADEETLGYYAFRVSDIKRTPEIDEFLERVTQLMERFWGITLSVPIADIDQIGGQVVATIRPSRDDPKKKNFMLTPWPSVFRFKRDIDWHRELDKTFGKTTSLQKSGVAYYRVELPEKMKEFSYFQRLGSFYAFPLSPRVILFTAFEETLQEVIAAKKKGFPKPDWHEQARRVEGATLAIVIPDSARRRKLAADPNDNGASPGEKTAGEALNAILAKTQTANFSIDVREQFRLQFSVNAKASNVADVGKQCERIVKYLKDSAAEPAKGKSGADDPIERLGLELMKNIRVKQNADGVQVITQSKEGADSVWKAALQFLAALGLART